MPSRLQLVFSKHQDNVNSIVVNFPISMSNSTRVSLAGYASDKVCLQLNVMKETEPGAFIQSISIIILITITTTATVSSAAVTSSASATVL